MFPQSDFGDLNFYLQFYSLYCAQRISVKAVYSVSQDLVERPGFCSIEKDG